MDDKLKRKWIKALRSGEYLQGDSALCTADGKYFCCLGVLADIQGAVWAEDANDFFGEALHPIIPGVKPSKNCDIPAPREAGGLRKSVMQTLAQMNDNGKSFSQIADYIEKRL